MQEFFQWEWSLYIIAFIVSAGGFTAYMFYKIFIIVELLTKIKEYSFLSHDKLHCSHITYKKMLSTLKKVYKLQSFLKSQKKVVNFKRFNKKPCKGLDEFKCRSNEMFGGMGAIKSRLLLLKKSSIKPYCKIAALDANKDRGIGNKP